VAGTPDLAQIAAILHRTAEVGASGGERAISAVAVHDQQAGTAAETENLAGIRLQLRELGGDDVVSSEIYHCRRDKITQYWVDERGKRSEQAATEEDFNQAAARRFGLAKSVSRHLLRPLPQEPLQIRIASLMGDSSGSSRTHFQVTLHLAQPPRLELVQAVSNDDRQI
jgi:hypothetical protein